MKSSLQANAMILAITIASFHALQTRGAVTTSGDVMPGEEDFVEHPTVPNALQTGTVLIGLNGGDGTLNITDAGTYRTLFMSGLNMARGTVNLGGTLFTSGWVELGQDDRPVATVDITGGTWNAPSETVRVGHGGEALIEVRSGGLLNRSYLNDFGEELTLNLGTIRPADGTRGHGTLRIRGGGQVTGNVVVGAGGDGVLDVRTNGVLGSADVEGEADFLTVGSGAGAIGTATFADGATANNAYWTIGDAGGTGTLTVNGAVATQADVLSVRLGRDGGTGTLNLIGGSLETQSLRLALGSGLGIEGNAALNLDGASLTVRGDMSAGSAAGSSNTTSVIGNSTLTTLGFVYFGASQASAEMTLSQSTWNASGYVELGWHGSQAEVRLEDGATWQHGPKDGGGGHLITSGGDSGPTSGNSVTLLTLSGGATWNVGVPTYLSDRGRTTITLNGTSTWTASEDVYVSRVTSHFTDLILRDLSTCWWRRGVTSVGSGDFNVRLHGGTFILGDDEHTGAFDVAWLDAFTAGTLDVRGGGTIGGTLPALGAGMHVAAGHLNSARLPGLEGGTLTLGEVIVDEQGGGSWTHIPSGGGSGLTYDLLSLRHGGHLIATTPFHAGGVAFGWNGGHLESRAALTLGTRSAWGYVDAYVVDEGARLTLRGADATVDLSDAATAVLGNPYSMGVVGWLTLDAGASLTTAATDVRYGAEVEVSAGATWTSEGNVFIAGNMMKSSQVTLDGGEWISRGGVHLGVMGMEMGSGIVTLEPNGVWRAENGYTLEPGFGQVHLTGGTLVYGLNEEGRRLDFETFTQLASFSSGTLVVFGDILGDIDLLPGATLTASHVTGNVVNGGIFLPGHSPAASVIEGDYTHEQGATIEMELYGPTPGSQHDTLEVQGATTIQGGTLAIRLGNYSPALNQTFALFNWTPAPQSVPFDAIVFVDRDGYAAALDYETGVLTISEAGVQIDPNPVAIASVTFDPLDGLTLEFEGKAGHSYTLQFTANLLTASEPPPVGWHAVAIVTSESPAVSISHPSESPAGFYRVVSP